MQQQRQLNIELLRIFSMLLITLEHVKQHFMTDLGSSISDSFMGYMMIFILFHVDLFILITGYFGVRHCTKPLVKNVLLIYFYSILLNIVTWVITGDFNMLDAFMPITHSNWWFMRMYILMLMIAPLIEYYVKDCSRKQVNMMVLGVLFVNLYLSHFCHVKHIYDEGFGIVNFVSIYIFGVWVRKEGMLLVNRLRYSRVSILVAVLAIMAIQYKLQPYFSTMALTEYCSPYSILMAMLIFLLFLKTNIPESFRKVIMFFSSSAIAVYLITEQPAIREMLQPLFSALYLPHCDSVMGIAIIFLSVIVAFVICCIIDKIRIPITDYLSKKILNIPFVRNL